MTSTVRPLELLFIASRSLDNLCFFPSAMEAPAASRQITIVTSTRAPHVAPLKIGGLMSFFSCSPFWCRANLCRKCMCNANGLERQPLVIETVRAIWAAEPRSQFVPMGGLNGQRVSERFGLVL